MGVAQWFNEVATIAKWELKRFSGTMSRDILPVAIILFVLLIGATGLTQQSGLHLQDEIYTAGSDSDTASAILLGDSRFTVYSIPQGSRPSGFDLIVSGGNVYAADTDKGMAALKAFDKDYSNYKIALYNRERDLFAAYPLWIEEQTVESELDFTATQIGTMGYYRLNPNEIPTPDNPGGYISPPSGDIDISIEELRNELIAGEGQDDQLSRYSDVISGEGIELEYKIPSQMSPSLPFDSIILVFVFIFPLYFTSQFYMMSIMNERIERSGEALLSAPLSGWQIITGKGLPYFLMMLGITVVLTAFTGGEFLILLPIFPVILFFLAFALLIGMLARSFKELSFISIFFSTVATSYIFFPSIFANIHIIGKVSPLTLVIMTLEGESYTGLDYVYSTALFFLTSAVIFYISAKNFSEERLFSYNKLMARIREFISTIISRRWTNTSLLLIAALTIPFVFMAQLMCLVLFFNLPMPTSLILMLVSAAFIEEFAKSIGIYTIAYDRPEWLTWKNIAVASLAVAAGFLAGEKLLLFATLAEISESVFGEIMFTSLQVLWMPLTLHFAGIFTTAVILKFGGRRAYIPALLAATLVHTAYNTYFIFFGGI
ncbi:ABC transporter permease [Methanolacinia paynteri]|uniref:ABC transporter permease n=1 Tax=Methanolacinia paynteri TaxID=230356 RepID=UPI00064E6D87|nr:ABC transporter permease [Methanolacinia paynteri]